MIDGLIARRSPSLQWCQKEQPAGIMAFQELLSLLPSWLFRSDTLLSVKSTSDGLSGKSMLSSSASASFSTSASAPPSISKVERFDSTSDVANDGREYAPSVWASLRRAVTVEVAGLNAIPALGFSPFKVSRRSSE